MENFIKRFMTFGYTIEDIKIFAQEVYNLNSEEFNKFLMEIDEISVAIVD
jgi:hypothetical protein